MYSLLRSYAVRLYTLSTKIIVPSFPGSMNSPTNDQFPVIYIVKKKIIYTHIAYKIQKVQA